MSSRLPYFFALITLGVTTVGLSGCESSDSSSGGSYSSQWTTDSEITTYCSDFCSSLECSDARGGACRNQCEYWLAGLGEKCGDELKATYACQAQLTCDEFDTFNADPRESEKCGHQFAAHVTACAPESPGCDAYCDLVDSCAENTGTSCHDGCNMRQGWFQGYYGADCVKASEALLECEGGLTCDDLDAATEAGTVPTECQDEQDAFDEACVSE